MTETMRRYGVPGDSVEREEQAARAAAADAWWAMRAAGQLFGFKSEQYKAAETKYRAAMSGVRSTY